ncbi:MAG: hypothetical protein HZA88_18670 [Verrucomicrobia bacterium]|nr:hypothetical protein [Verrucomicrobiota bacterium]
MADDCHHVTARGKVPQLAERVAEDKALQKAMAEVMKRMSDVETCPLSIRSF